MKYSDVKNSLKLKVVDGENLWKYENVVMKDVGCDLVLVPYHEPIDEVPVFITLDQVNEWAADDPDLTPQTLMEDAMKSAQTNEPGCVNSMENTISAMFGEATEAGIPLDRSPLEIPKSLGNMYIVTNESRINGASALFYPEVMEKIAASLDESFFILPSSNHEFILVGAETAPELKEFETMVYEINRSEVAPEDRLSDKVFYYDALQKEFMLASEHEKEVEMEEFLEEEEEMEL